MRAVLYWLCLALVAAAAAAPSQEDDSIIIRVDEVSSEEEEHLMVALPGEETEEEEIPDDIDFNDFAVEEEIDEDELDELADEIADRIGNETDGTAARSLKGGFKVFSKGLLKGGKKVGKAFMTAGKKVIKVTAKGAKIAGKGAGKGLIKLGKGVGKGMIKIGKGAGKGLIKVGKGAKKMVTKKGGKIWQALKKKFNGEMGKAAKKLLKSVGKAVLEKGFEMAIEAITPMILEYVMQKTQEGLCSCEGTMCSCCATPPGFDKGCLVMKVRPRMKIFTTAITYAGEELSRVNITASEDESEATCTKLPGILAYLEACIQPLGTVETEKGFRGCLAIGLEPLPLEREMCVDFSGTAKDGVAKWVSANEIDDVELEISAK